MLQSSEWTQITGPSVTSSGRRWREGGRGRGEGREGSRGGGGGARPFCRLPRSPASAPDAEDVKRGDPATPAIPGTGTAWAGDPRLFTDPPRPAATEAASTRRRPILTLDSVFRKLTDIFSDCIDLGGWVSIPPNLQKTETATRSTPFIFGLQAWPAHTHTLSN